MDTHLAGETTSLATCWRVTRTDGTEFHFTDHDGDIDFDGDTYKADTGYTRTAIQNDSSLSVDNLNLEGILDSAEITVDDLRAGLFDYAEIRIFVVNWADLTASDIKMRRGWIGEVTVTEQGIFRAELRGLSQALSQRMGEVYQPECRADLGDSRCTVPVDPALRQDSTTYSAGDIIKIVTAGAPDGTQSDYENRIYEATQAGTSAASAPSFDTTEGNTTQDGGTAADQDYNLPSNNTNGQTLTIEGQVYTFVTSLASAFDVLIGGTASDTLDNLVDAINDNAVNEGTTYGTGTTANTDVSAAKADSDTVTVTALTVGVAGNLIAVSESSNGNWSGATLSGGVDPVIWVARQAWTRHGEVDTVTDQKTFTLTVGFDESRATDDWFNGGALRFDSGLNAGKSIEVRDWTNSTREITLFLASPFTVAAGDKVALYPGCDKRAPTCATKFGLAADSTNFPTSRGNIRNFRGEPHIPGQDELTRYPDAKSG